MYKTPYYNKLIVLLILIFFIIFFFGNSSLFYKFSFEEAIFPLILIIITVVFGKQYKSINEIKEQLYIDLYKAKIKKLKIISNISQYKDKEIATELSEQQVDLENKILTIIQEIAIIDEILNENSKNT